MMVAMWALVWTTTTFMTSGGALMTSPYQPSLFRDEQECREAEKRINDQQANLDTAKRMTRVTCIDAKFIGWKETGGMP